MLLLLWLGVSELPQLGNVEWTELTYTEGCFFFAGPGAMGRDASLGYEATASPGEIRFGTLAFMQQKPGNYRRLSSHDFHGTWQVVQRLDGDWTGGGFAGHYSYVEQKNAGDTGKPCVIEANVRIRL